jgi:transposase
MTQRQFHLSDSDLQAFRTREQQTRDTHELKRLQAVRLYGSGFPMAQILQMVVASESRLRQWVQLYRAGGLTALQSKWQGNNAKKLTDAQRADLRTRLTASTPRSWHLSDRLFWTTSDVQTAIEQWYGVVYASARSYVYLMHECGFSFQRTRKVYRSRAHDQTIADFEAELEKK